MTMDIDTTFHVAPVPATGLSDRDQACHEILDYLDGRHGQPASAREIVPNLTTRSKNVWNDSVNSLIAQKFVIKTGSKATTLYFRAVNISSSEFDQYVSVKPRPKKKKAVKQKVTLDQKKVAAAIEQEMVDLEAKVADLTDANTKLSEFIEARPLFTLDVFADHVRMSREDAVKLLA